MRNSFQRLRKLLRLSHLHSINKLDVMNMFGRCSTVVSIPACHAGVSPATANDFIFFG
jgi:hypothetical protein